MTRLISEESKGVFVIMATPFTDDGSLDLQSTDRLVEFCLEEGVHGVSRCSASWAKRRNSRSMSRPRSRTMS